MRRHVEDTNRIAAASFLAALTAGTLCPPASAQTGDRVAAAAALFDDAKTMMERGNFPEACPKLAESQSLDPQVGTMLNLALCYESIGRTASGCAMWRSAGAAAARKLQSDREELARERAASVCSRAPQIAIAVAPQVDRDHVEVRLNDVVVPRERWESPQLVDPGEYVLRATGEGSRPWSSTVVVDEQHPAVVVVPVLAREGGAAAPATPPDRPRRPATGAWIAGGVGLAGLAAGSAFGVAALLHDAAATSGSNCVRDNCNPAGQRDRQRAIEDARIADVTFAISAGALLTSAVLWLVTSNVHPAPGVYVQPAIAERDWALSVGEVW
jgi:hypothetical protein